MRPLALQMEQAEERGDRLRARQLAKAILGAGERAASEDNASDEARDKADALLARTEPDPFLLFVGIAGLGLMVWLVYNYVL